MGRSSKSAWLEGPGDLQTAVVENVPAPGEDIEVRGLPAAYSNQAASEALELISGEDGSQRATVNSARMSVLQFAHGCVDPEFSVAEAEQIAQKYGPAFNRVVAKIDELSGVDKKALADAEVRFPAGGGDSASTGGDGPDVPDGTGGADEDAA